MVAAMSNQKKRNPIACTHLFRDLAIEISRHAGFAHLKKGQEYTRKKGFSNLINEITEKGKIVVEGNHKYQTEKLNRELINHNNNIGQLIKRIGNEIFQSKEGKSYTVNQIISDYHAASEPASAFIKDLITQPPSYVKTHLEMADELVEAAKDNTREMLFTFVTTPETDKVFSHFNGGIRKAVAHHIESAYVEKKDFNVDAAQQAKLDSILEIFSKMNELTRVVNELLKANKPVAYSSVANKLLHLIAAYKTIGT